MIQGANMDIIEVIKNRRSIRSFTSEPVLEEDIKKIIEAAIWAPSGGDSQPWEFLVIKNESKKKELVKIIKEEIEKIAEEEIKDENEKRIMKTYSKYFTFFHKAPVVIVVYGKEERSKFMEIINKYRSEDKALKSTSFVQSMAASIENMLLRAESLGYGTCWMTGPLLIENELKKVLGIEEQKTIVAIVPMGKPRIVPAPPPRKDINKQIKYI